MEMPKDEAYDHAVEEEEEEQKPQLLEAPRNNNGGSVDNGVVAEEHHQEEAVHYNDGRQLASKGSNNQSAGCQVPPGIRFQPTDEELVAQYLMRKINGEKLPLPPKIYEADINRYNPETLAATYGAEGGKWYFFSPRYKKYKHGKRPRRDTDGGYWKATGADRAIKSSNGEVIGHRKSLVFYQGKPSNGIKTKWIMQEYCLSTDDETPQITPKDNDHSAGDMLLDKWVLYRIYLKTRNTKDDDDADDEVAPKDDEPNNDRNDAANSNKRQRRQPRQQMKEKCTNGPSAVVPKTPPPVGKGRLSSSIMEEGSTVRDCSIIGQRLAQTSNLSFMLGNTRYGGGPLLPADRYAVLPLPPQLSQYSFGQGPVAVPPHPPMIARNHYDMVLPASYGHQPQPLAAAASTFSMPMGQDFRHPNYTNAYNNNNNNNEDLRALVDSSRFCSSREQHTAAGDDGPDFWGANYSANPGGNAPTWPDFDDSMTGR